MEIVLKSGKKKLSAEYSNEKFLRFLLKISIKFMEHGAAKNPNWSFKVF